ncbi:MAG: hypothetical protein WA892_05205 [Ornithinimicrobium sp.]
MARRWQQLPLGHALAVYPQVHALVQHIADEVAELTGMSPRAVPDMGPAVVVDQLRVMVYDHATAGGEGGLLAEKLADLRRALP